MGLTAYGLLRRKRWGWWLGVLMPALFLMTVVAAGIVALSFAGEEGLVGMAGSLTDVAAGLVLLLASVILLLLPSSRAAFRQPRPPV